MLINDLENLPNIIGSIVANDSDDFFLSDDDKLAIFEACLHAADEYILSNPTAITDPDFSDNILEEVEEIIDELFMKPSQFNDSIFFNEQAEDYLSDEMDTIIADALAYYFDCFMPSRMQLKEEPTTHASQPQMSALSESQTDNAAAKIEKIAKQIAYLETKPQPTQRTPEWYTFRHNLITASNAYKAFESQSSKNQLIYEKCTPIRFGDDGKQRVNVESPLHWGQKYEPISVLYYEDKYKTTVQDFGCIQHDKYSFLGASPDGIIVDKASPNYGRMLEIKNPVSREITGIPKKEYWVQMQLQMETCDLDECDFLETKFTEYQGEEDYNSDGTFMQTEKGQLKGVMLYFSDQDNCPKYVYKPLSMDKEEFIKWEEELIELYEGEKNMTWIKNNYWKLEQVSCVLVLRNRLWFEANIPALESLWNTVLEERKTGHEHRAPKKKQQQAQALAQAPIQVNKITNYMNPFVLTKIDINVEPKPAPVKTSGCLINLKTDSQTGIVTVVKKL
jgi:putative phage-type endonuclease